MRDFTKKFFLLSVFLTFILPVFFAHAEVPTYKLISGTIPYVSAVPEGGGLAGYLDAFFKLGLGIAVTLAILVFVYNGVVYMTSDVVGNKEDAKKAFFGVVTGLVIVFGSVLVLGTINPDLVKFKLFTTLDAVGEKLESDQAASGGGGGGDGDGTTDPVLEGLVRDELASNGITVNQNACEPGQGMPDCINVGDLPQAAIDKLISLKNDCSCEMVITGGTENGHTTHGPGNPMVDLRKTPSLNSFLERAENFVRVQSGGNLYSYNGSEYWDEPGPYPHWHSCMGTQCGFAGETP